MYKMYLESCDIEDISNCGSGLSLGHMIAHLSCHEYYGHMKSSQAK